MVVLTSPAVHAADTAPLKPDDFLSRYCLDCHDGDVQKGERRLDDLPLSVGTDIAIAERWQEVLHQLQLGEMPPAKKKQPTDAERRALFVWIEEQLTQAQSAAQSRGGGVVHRRLSRAEYLHTVQDLFGFAGEFDPTTGFPGDEELEGFRNIGSVLRTSRHHLEQYLKAADAVLDHAYDLAEVNGKPAVKEWKDSAEEMGGLNNAFGLGVISAENAKGHAYIRLSHGLRNQELIFDSKLFLSRLGDIGLPHSGWYEVEVEATAANRHHSYGKDLMLGGLTPYYKDLKSYYDESKPMQLGIGRQGEGMKGNGWRLIPPNIVHATELPEVCGDHLQRVSLPADSPRRGLLGQAGILTTTANGVETSPVTCGVWLLEKLFGTPPSSPPPDVPPIEPDIRGATTIRQQLEKHRNVQACADCHDKIDPLGYTLEAYDPIGRFRSVYPNGAAIDTTGEYRGQPVNSPADIRAYLVQHPSLIFFSSIFLSPRTLSSPAKAPTSARTDSSIGHH